MRDARAVVTCRRVGLRSSRVAAAVWFAAIVTWLACVAAPSARADFSGDGAADVIAVDGAGSMRLYRGSGTGGFADNSVRIDGSGKGWGAYTQLIYAGDFTGDGKPDLFARGSDGVLGTLRVFRGNGAGGFVDDGTLIGNGWGAFTAVVAPGDWSGDGRADVIARLSNGTLRLFRGDGSGGFLDNGIDFGSGGGWNAFNGLYSGGDFSGDGKPDLLARRASDGALFLYRGNGAGGWLGSGQIGGGWNSLDVILPTGDFTGDGMPDVLARTPGGAMLVYRGNGVAGFADNGTVIGYYWHGFTALVAARDFSGDGKPDILARLADGSLRMLRGNGAGGLLDNGEPAGNGWDTVVDIMSPGDFNGDRKADLLSRTADGRLRLHPGDNNGGFAQSATLIGNGWGGLTAVIAPGDFNADGKSDVLARTPEGAMLLYRGNGAGGFIDNGIQVGGQWHIFADIHPAGDFDGDGDPDVLARTSSGQLYLYRGAGNSSGGFADNGTLLGNYWNNFDALMSGADFSGDGIPDVLARKPDGWLYLYRGNGAGGFADNGTALGRYWDNFRLMVLTRPPTRFGGGNGVIDTEAEVGAVLTALGAAESDAEWYQIWNALTPGEQALVRQGLARRDDSLLRDLSDGRVYLYATGAVAWVTNTTVANRLELDMSSAINVPHAVIDSYRRAWDITEAELNSPDEPSPPPGDATIAAAGGHPKADKGYFWEEPDPNPDYEQNRFVFSNGNNKVQFRGTIHWYRHKWRLWKRYVQWQNGSRSEAMTAGSCQASAFGAKWGFFSGGISWSTGGPGVSFSFGGQTGIVGYSKCPADPYTNAADIRWGGHRPISPEGKIKGNIRHVVVSVCWPDAENQPCKYPVSKKGNRNGNIEDW